MEKRTTLRRLAAYALAAGLLLTFAGAVDARIETTTDLDLEPLAVPVQDGSATGAGLATFDAGGCPQYSDIVEISGSGSDGVWTFTYSVNSLCDGWMHTDTVSGPWAPDEGGCFALQTFFQLCLEGPTEVVPGTVATYQYSNSFDFNSGDVVLVFS